MKLRTIEVVLWPLSLAGIAVLLGFFAWGTFTLEADKAVLTLETTPARASAWIDGHYVGTTPVTLDEVGVGTHVLRVQKFGYVEMVRDVEVTHDAPEVHVALKKAPGGTCHITSSPGEAEVFIDGERRGRTPLTVGNLQPGAHEVRLRRVNFLDWTGTVHVEPDGTARRHVALKSRTEAGYLADIRRDAKDVKARTDLAHYYILQDEWKKAEDAFTDALVVAARTGDGYSDRLFQEVEKVFRSMFKYSDVKRGRDAVLGALIRTARTCPTYATAYRVALHYGFDMDAAERLQGLVETALLNIPKNRYWAVMGLPRRVSARYTIDQLRSLLEQRLRKSPKDFAARYQLAVICLQRGRTDDAIGHFDQLAAQTAAPRVKARLLAEVGRLHGSRKRYDKAADAWRRAAEAETVPEDRAPLQYHLAGTLQKLGKNEDALVAWEQAVRHQQDVELACQWRLDWARLCIRTGKEDKARTVLGETLKQSKSSVTRDRAKTLLKTL